MEDGQVINLIVSDSLYQEVYQNIGDTFSYCISTPTSKRNGNLVYKPNSCQLKYKVRAIASMKKMPGFPKFSSYKQMNLIGPGVIATESQVEHVIDRLTESYPSFRETRNLALESQHPSTHGLTKEAVYVKFKKDHSEQDRINVKNAMLAVNEETNFIIFDTLKQLERFRSRLKLNNVFNMITSMICFTLGTF